jgi:hypothetical protein
MQPDNGTGQVLPVSECQRSVLQSGMPLLIRTNIQPASITLRRR